jgi:FliI/YscN family ATPase
MSEFDARPYLERLESGRFVEPRGRVRSAVGLVVRATLPETWIGELCEICPRGAMPPILAEVVGFRGDEAILLPFAPMREIGTQSLVRRCGTTLTLRAGDGLVGRVLDGLGRPLDGRPLESCPVDWPVHASPPDALSREPIERVFATGVRVVDGLLTMGAGQRVGVFAGAGVGKSTLLGALARGAEADVVVVGLVGERGREVREFLERDLGPGALARSVAVVATSDQPALVRLKAAYVATAVAEYFRARGLRVLLLLDSLTRFARARREVGLAAGEPPARGGFPPSVFAELPQLLERAGNDWRGSITAIYTVLVEGDDHSEPVADEARSILDGHVVLSAELSGRGVFPAVDVARSVSRVMGRVVDPEHARAARRVRELLATYDRDRDLLLLGAYESGTDPRVDEAMAKIAEIERFVRQEPDETTPFHVTRAQLEYLASPPAEPPPEEAIRDAAESFQEDDV